MIFAIYLFYVIPMVIVAIGYIHIKDEVFRISNKNGYSDEMTMVAIVLLCMTPVINILLSIGLIAKIVENIQE